MQYSAFVKHSVRQTINRLSCSATSIQSENIYLFIYLFIYLLISSSTFISQYSISYSHVMISLSSWFFLCHCLSEAIAHDIDFQCLYELHAIFTINCRYCSWFLQAQQAQEIHVDQDSQIWSDDIAKAIKKSVESVQKQLQLIQQKWQIEQTRMLEQEQKQNDEKLRAKQVRLIQQQIDKKVEEIVIAKIKIETFACKRCSAKYFSNIKFHEHIRDHHAKKSKFVVSSSFTFFMSFFTSSHLTIFLFESSKSASQSKILSISFFTFSISIFSLNFSSMISSKFSFTAIKISFFSSFASEFVSKHSKNTIICSFIFSFISQKFAAMRSTFFYNLSSKFYFTIDDLFSMFAEKDMRAKLFAIQNSFFFSNIFVFRQARIISYFLLVIKSTKFEIFTSVYDSIKQSTRISFSRFSSSRSFSSIRFLFSINFYFFFVCWRCQKSFVIYLFRNWTDFIVAKVEISMKRRERRLFV